MVAIASGAVVVPVTYIIYYIIYDVCDTGERGPTDSRARVLSAAIRARCVRQGCLIVSVDFAPLQRSTDNEII